MTQEQQDKDDIRLAISIFAAEMQEKMFKKYDEGKRGWDDPKNKSSIRNSLKADVVLGDWIDAANKEMFLHRFEQQENKT